MKYWIYASIQRPILVCFTCISGLFSEVLGYNLNLIVSYYFSLDQISVNETCFTSFSVSWGKWLLQHQFFSGPQVAMSRLQATDLLSPCVRFTRISLVQIIFKKVDYPFELLWVEQYWLSYPLRNCQSPDMRTWQFVKNLVNVSAFSCKLFAR